MSGGILGLQEGNLYVSDDRHALSMSHEEKVLPITIGEEMRQLHGEAHRPNREILSGISNKGGWRRQHAAKNWKQGVNALSVRWLGREM